MLTLYYYIIWYFITISFTTFYVEVSQASKLPSPVTTATIKTSTDPCNPSPNSLGGLSYPCISNNEREALLAIPHGNAYGWGGSAGTECSAWEGVICSTITDSLNTYKHVDAIALSQRGITGSLPSSISNLAYLSKFSLFGNQLSGTIPNLSGMRYLTYFNVISNQLTGSIPELNTLTHLENFYVDNNQLTGSIPPLNTLTNLQYFYVANNQLSGAIPPLNTLTNLQYFVASNNQLSNAFPNLSGLTKLEKFDVENNKLNGKMPLTLPQSLPSKIGWLRICGNYLETTISKEGDAVWNAATDTEFSYGWDVPGWRECQKLGNLYLRNPLADRLKNNPLPSFTNLSPPFTPPLSLTQAVDAFTVSYASETTAMAADGVSAVVIALRGGYSSNTVTFSVNNGATLTKFSEEDSIYSGYLDDLSWSEFGTGTTTLQVSRYPISNTFLALLWPPKQLPATTGSTLRLPITLTVKYNNNLDSMTKTIDVVPPPLLLIHGVWSSAEGARFSKGSGGFGDWIRARYENAKTPVIASDYGIFSNEAFYDPRIQGTFQHTARKLLVNAATAGIMARQIDVFAHSMGGLVTRYFLASNPPDAAKTPNSLVHQLITIGTPHLGSALAVELWEHKGDIPSTVVVKQLCKTWYNLCTLENVLDFAGRKVAGAVNSLQHPEDYLPPSVGAKLATIEGRSPTNSFTEVLLNALVGAYTGGLKVDDVLGPNNDTIVASGSQTYVDPTQTSPSAIVDDIVHTDMGAFIPDYIPDYICPDYLNTCRDLSETASHSAWNIAFEWLVGQAPVVPAVSQRATTDNTPLPSLDLTNYTEVPASVVEFAPASGTNLIVRTPISITPNAPSKTITEIWLFQKVVNPTDIAMLYATQVPFKISYTPTHLGIADFVAFALFSDMTYAVTKLSYPLVTAGNATTLSLVDAPESDLWVGLNLPIKTYATFTNGTNVDVTQVAMYKQRSGNNSVFTIESNNTITANGEGSDWLDVTYNNLTVATQIKVMPDSNDGLIRLKIFHTGNGTVQSSLPGFDYGTYYEVAFPIIPGIPTITVTLTAIPNSGATFLNWSGACSGTSITCTISMTANQQVIATFSSNNYFNVTPSASNGGTFAPNTPQTVNYGATTNFTVTPNSGYNRNPVVGGTCPQGSWNGNVWTTGAIVTNCTVTFSFTANTPIATTGVPTNITQTSAKLNGAVISAGPIATVSFDFGTTIAYGTNVAAIPTQVHSSTAVAVTATKTGLTCGTTYYYRTKAVNSAGTRYGLNKTFATAACPDLVITNAVLTPVSPVANGTFTATVTVKNQGTGAGDGKFLDVWSHQPAAKVCGAVGNKRLAVGMLAAGASKTLTFTGLPAGIAGMKMLRAFVDSGCSTKETNEGNNQRIVIYPVNQATVVDFVVTAVTLNPTAPTANGTFTATVTVKNQGTVPGDGKFLDVWSHQPTGQVCGAVGNKRLAVGILAARAVKNLTFSGLPAGITGAKTFRAFIDSGCGTAENYEGNNQMIKSYTVR